MSNIPPLRLPALNARWAHTDLAQSLSSAQKTPGRVIQTTYTENGSQYVLSVVVPVTSRDLRLRKETSTEAEPQWTLVKENENGPPTQLWTYGSRDQGLILNFIYAELDGVGKAAQPQLASPQHKAPEAKRPSGGAFKTLDSSLDAHADVMLAGDLSKMELSNLLQSIQICQMTGRLDFNNGTQQTEVFFDKGKLVHAVAQDVLSLEGEKTTGDTAFLDLFTWTKGNFRFNPGWGTKETTVQRRMDALLLEGVTLQDHEAHLKKCGMSKNVFVCQKDPTITEKKLIDRLKEGVPIDIDEQIFVYNKIATGIKVDELFKSIKMIRPNLIPILFNLATSDAVIFVTSLDTVAVPVKSVQIDSHTVAQAALALVRSDTGVMNFPLYAHFVEHECARAKDSGQSFAVACFEITNRATPLTDMEVRQMIKRFELFRRPYDLFAHYQSTMYVLLLPLMNGSAAREKLDKFANMLITTPLGDFDQFQELKIKIGVASYPDDGKEVQVLLSTAINEMSAARQPDQGMSKVDWDILCAKAEMSVKDEQFDEAVKIWSDAYDKSKEFSQDDPRLLQAVDGLAAAFERMERHDEAEPLLKLALELKTRQFGAADLRLAETAYQLARCLYVQEKYADAEMLANQFITLAESALGAQHTTVAKGWYNLAVLYHVQKKIPEAELAYKRALEISREIFGEEDPETLKIKKNLAKLLASRTGASVFKDMTRITGTWKAIEFSRQHELHRL